MASVTICSAVVEIFLCSKLHSISLIDGHSDDFLSFSSSSSFFFSVVSTNNATVNRFIQIVLSTGSFYLSGRDSQEQDC